MLPTFLLIATAKAGTTSLYLDHCIETISLRVDEHLPYGKFVTNRRPEGVRRSKSLMNWGFPHGPK